VNQSDGPPPEIVIIRRGGGGEEEGHHGGAWKIAYADFMTAMMALFLVLWLISATDEQTLSQVTTYFNPIELTDRTTTDRGVQDLQQGGTGKPAEKQPAKNPELEGNDPPKNSAGRPAPSDEGLFADPYQVLDKLAQKAAKTAKVALPSSTGIRQDGEAGSGAGEAFRDPFDPDFRNNSFWEETTPAPPIAQGKPPEIPGEVPAEQTPHKGVPLPDQAAKEEPKPGEAVPAEAQIATETKQIESALRQAISDAGLIKLPDISVQQTPEGILISMTDQSDFEMFAVSSAEPRPELIVLMESLGKILSDQPGSIVLRGYTDGRPFRSKTYDNWRLSTARAHIAYYMLSRGGVEKQRFERIEGYADRNLKVPDDPNAAQNRRIEILLRPVQT
jgi:chemotaxis protein MotB